MATFVAILSVRVEQAKKKMIEAGAVSPETAKTAKELGVDEFHVKTRLAKRRGIVATADGRYYLKATT